MHIQGLCWSCIEFIKDVHLNHNENPEHPSDNHVDTLHNLQGFHQNTYLFAHNTAISIVTFVLPHIIANLVNLTLSPIVKPLLDKQLAL